MKSSHLDRCHSIIFTCQTLFVFFLFIFTVVPSLCFIFIMDLVFLPLPDLFILHFSNSTAARFNSIIDDVIRLIAIFSSCSFPPSTVRNCVRCVCSLIDFRLLIFSLFLLVHLAIFIVALFRFFSPSKPPCVQTTPVRFGHAIRFLCLHQSDFSLV